MISQEGPPNEFVSTAAVAARLAIHRVNAAALVRSGRLPAIKVANRWLVRRDDLERCAQSYRKGCGRPRLKNEDWRQA